MAATAAQIAQVRRMVNEPTTATYSDATIQAYIEVYPLLDERGEEPYTWDSSTTPPHQDVNTYWVPTYDLHAAAADLWEEKASVVAVDYNFSADGGNYSRSQVYEQYMKQARYHRARRRPQTSTLFMYPKPRTAVPETWVANQAEEND